jgi:hypothetical protein
MDIRGQLRLARGHAADAAARAPGSERQPVRMKPSRIVRLRWRLRNTGSVVHWVDNHERRRRRDVHTPWVQCTSDSKR